MEYNNIEFNIMKLDSCSLSNLLTSCSITSKSLSKKMKYFFKFLVPALIVQRAAQMDVADVQDFHVLCSFDNDFHNY